VAVTPRASGDSAPVVAVAVTPGGSALVVAVAMTPGDSALVVAVAVTPGDSALMVAVGAEVARMRRMRGRPEPRGLRWRVGTARKRVCSVTGLAST
jgi:hypothetical protein